VGTKHRGNETERRALDAFIKLSRASAAVDARINRPLAASDLTASQFGVLEAIWHLGPLSHGAIGRKLLKSSGNVTVVIDNLVRRGLVRRERDPFDRRVSRVALTAAGRALLEEAFPAHVARVVAAFSALSQTELDTLADLLRRLGRAADGADATGSPGTPDGAEAAGSPDAATLAASAVQAPPLPQEDAS
jgi:MarR family transcriptional regulator, 2-MHQ and catechol-resistance regulon repressor